MLKKKGEGIEQSENQEIYNKLFDQQKANFKDKHRIYNNLLIILGSLLIADLIYLAISIYFMYGDKLFG